MTDLKVEEDTADMAALRAGEKAALDRLMNRWQVPLRVFLRRHLQDESTALDLAQETFVRVYRNATSYRPGARFSTWLFAIALNLLRDRARQLSRRPTEPLDEAVIVAGDYPPDEMAERDERAEAVRKAITELPEELRTVVVLSEYEELSQAEIAEIVSSTPKAVESRLYRARQQLRKSLSRWLN